MGFQYIGVGRVVSVGRLKWLGCNRESVTNSDADEPSTLPTRLSPHIVIINTILVGVAQLAEHRTVAPTVAGSIPVSHPNSSKIGQPWRFGCDSGLTLQSTADNRVGVRLNG